MIIIKHKFTFLAFAFFCSACVNKQNNNSIVTTDEKVDTLIESSKNDDLKIVIHYTDSTNFDNFKPQNPLSAEQIKGYQLSKLDFPAENYYLIKDIPYPDQFKTKVFTATTEMEIKTYIINYDLSGNMITNLVIAYDEIAESAFRTISKINNNTIIVTNYNYMEEPATKTIETYKIQPNGTIKKL